MFFLVIDLDSGDEAFPAVAFSEMLDSDVDSFFDFSISDFLVQLDSDRAGVDVEDSASSAVIPLIGHSFVNGSIDYNIDILAFPESGEVVLDSDGSVSSEGLGELLSGACSYSVTMGH